MKLEFKEIGGKTPHRWTFERGRRTVGRSNDCDWQVSDETRAISKLHCTIERDRQGFLLRDESANGTRVDGKMVLEGETARLDEGSQVEIANRAFAVSVSGLPDGDMEDPGKELRLSDEALTISSILADVAPGGRSAAGVLGGRDAGELPLSRSQSTSPSRNVEIGWSGSPLPQKGGGFLPDNWHEEDASSEYGTQIEHGSATHLSVPIAPIRRNGNEAIETPPPAAEPMDVLTSIAEGSFETTVAAAPARADTRIDPIISEFEAAIVELHGIFEIEFTSAGHRHADSPAARLTALLDEQLRFVAALRGAVSDLSQAIEPRILEARTDAQPRKLPWKTDRSYWQVYRENFRDGEKDLALRDVMHKMMLSRLGLAAGNEDEGE